MVKYIAFIFLILGSGCQNETEDNCSMKSIGIVTMNEDMSLTLQLRATDENSTKVGDALIFVNTSDPLYKTIMSEVEPIKPGQTKDYFSDRKCIHE